MKQYLDLLQNILDNGVEKESGRANMPNTIGVSHAVIQMDLQKGFPLLTTKKMYLKGIIHELLWFLRGETNIKYLVDNNVNIWNGDAYRWYLKRWGKADGAYTMEEFIEKIKEGQLTLYTKKGDWTNPEVLKNTWESYRLGDLGKVYGYQWRNQNGVDQVRDVIEGLKSNPYSRYHIIDGWNKADFKEMALPPCHLLYQFIVRPLNLKERSIIAVSNHYEISQSIKLSTGIDQDAELHKQLDDLKIPRFYLDLNMYQRSCDTFLGVPFNIASMSTLLLIFAKTSNMVPGISTWIGGDTHLYVDHLPQVKEQLSRVPKKLPQLYIKKELNNLDDILALIIDDFELSNYESYDSIKAELFTGLKK
jgi:thymidylate synthase